MQNISAALKYAWISQILSDNCTYKYYQIVLDHYCTSINVSVSGSAKFKYLITGKSKRLDLRSASHNMWKIWRCCWASQTPHNTLSRRRSFKGWAKLVSITRQLSALKLQDRHAMVNSPWGRCKIVVCWTNFGMVEISDLIYVRSQVPRYRWPWFLSSASPLGFLPSPATLGDISGRSTTLCRWTASPWIDHGENRHFVGLIFYSQ